ncbi:MAG: helix-turn-helix domain-containing protein, partial [Candidatus Poribacteria bacterium]
PRPATSKSSPKEVKKSLPQVEKTQTPKKSQQPPRRKTTPSQKPTVKVSPTEREKKTPEKMKQEVKPQEPVFQASQGEPAPERASQKKRQKRKLTYGDRYMLKQIREKTPMVFEMYNHESIFCTVTKLFKYDLELLVDGGEKIRIQKHNIKYCYKQENAEKVKASISFDESVRSQGLMPIIKRKERYQIDHNMVRESWGKRRKVRLVTREGEIITGALDWFSIYEVKVNLPPGGNVIVFFHALYDFGAGLSAEGVPKPSKPTQSKDFKVLSAEEASIRPSSAEKIRIARKALGMSQKALADLFGVSTQTIGNWERGKNQPQTKYQEQIEQFFATAQEASP